MVQMAQGGAEDVVRCMTAVWLAVKHAVSAPLSV